MTFYIIVNPLPDLFISTFLKSLDNKMDLRNRPSRHNRELDVNLLSSDDKIWLGEQHVDEKVSIPDLQAKFGIAKRTLEKYAMLVRKKVMPHIGNGRPIEIDETNMKWLADQISVDRYNIRESEYDKQVVIAVKNTCLSRGVAYSQHSSLSRNTLKAIDDRIQAVTKNAEVSTSARKVACEDIRNMVSFAAMNHFIDSQTNGSGLLKCNVDATCYTVGNKMNKIAKVKVIKGSNKKDVSIKTAPLPEEKSDGLFTVKCYILIFAEGHFANPIYIIENKNMDVDTYDTHIVPGLGIHANIENDFGFIVFTRDRSLTSSFYEWFLQAVLVPQITLIRHHFQCPQEKCFLQLDGEAVQISCFFEEPTIQLMAENNIFVGKSAASTTEIQQPCDRGNLFKASKMVVKHHTCELDEDLRKKYSRVANILKNLWSAHETKYGDLTYAQVRNGWNGILNVHNAFEQVVTKSIIHKSFLLTGVHPYNINTIMSSCATKIDRKTETKIIDSVEYFAQCLENNGEIYDEDFEHCGIPNNTSGKGSKDDLVMCRRRCLLLTHTKTVKRQQEYKLKREQALASAEQRKKEKAAIVEAKKRNVPEPENLESDVTTKATKAKRTYKKAKK